MSDPDHDPVRAASTSVSESVAAKVPTSPGPTPEPTLTLDTLLQTIYDSVSSQVRNHAGKALEHTLANYFTQDPQTGQPQPKVVQLALPGPNGTPIQRDIPLFALVQHHDVTIEQMRFRLPVSLHEDVDEGGQNNLTVSVATAEDPAAALAEIEIRFRGVDTAEGLARINDAIVGQIGPGAR